MEIAPESWKLLRSLASNISSNDEESQKLRQWFQEVESTLHQLVAEFNDHKLAKRSLQTLSLILQNALRPSRSREVNVKSIRFQETFGSSTASLQLLELAGFMQIQSDSGDTTLAFPVDGPKAQAERVFDLLQHALRKDSGYI